MRLLSLSALVTLIAVLAVHGPAAVGAVVLPNKNNNTASYGAAEATVTGGGFALKSALGFYYVGVDGAIKKYMGTGALVATVATVAYAGGSGTLDGDCRGATEIRDGVFYFISVGLKMIVRYDVAADSMQRVAGGGATETDGTGAVAGFAVSATTDAMVLNDDHTALYVSCFTLSFVRKVEVTRGMAADAGVVTKVSTAQITSLMGITYYKNSRNQEFLIFFRNSGSALNWISLADLVHHTTTTTVGGLAQGDETTMTLGYGTAMAKPSTGFAVRRALVTANAAPYIGTLSWNDDVNSFWLQVGSATYPTALSTFGYIARYEGSASEGNFTWLAGPAGTGIMSVAVDGWQVSGANTSTTGSPGTVTATSAVTGAGGVTAGPGATLPPPTQAGGSPATTSAPGATSAGGSPVTPPPATGGGPSSPGATPSTTSVAPRHEMAGAAAAAFAALVAWVALV